MLSTFHLPQALCALLLLCVPTFVTAQTSEEVVVFEGVVSDGLRAYQAGQYVEARTRFERAHALMPSARTLRALGMTAVELRNYTAARVELEASLVDTRQPLTAAQRGEVSQMLTWMGSTLASVQVRVQPEGARILIDAKPGEARLLLEPGAHVLRVEADGYEPNEQRLELQAGQDRTLDVELSRVLVSALPALAPQAQLTAAADFSQPSVFTQPSPPSPRDQDEGSVLGKWWFWTAVGAVVVAASTTVAVVALNDKHDTAAEPPGTKVLVLTAGH